jgi:hypothetical protein
MAAGLRLALMLLAMISLTAMLGVITAPFYEAGVRALGLEPEMPSSMCEDGDA